MLFAFIDESGQPHPNDPSTRPVLATVCVRAEDLRALNTGLYRLKRDILGKDQFRVEAKANELLTRGTLKRCPDKREFVESFFEFVNNFPLVVFAIVMERPLMEPPKDRNILPMPFRYILQRIDRLTELGDMGSGTDLAAVMFDGDGSQSHRISERFSNWLFRSHSGRALTRLAESPFFVDSKFTPGIQVADMVAGVIRIYQENRLNEGVPAGDHFLTAISRYYRAVEQKSTNLPSPTDSSENWYGIYFMPERLHHFGETHTPHDAGETIHASGNIR